jgi:hypothetical protein
MDKNQYSTLMRFAHGAVTKEAAIGFFVCLIFDKELFKTNQDLRNFAETVFNIHFLPYAARSRTLMCAKICRIFNGKEQKDFINYGLSTRRYFESVFAETIHSSPSKKGSTALSNMDIWMSGILKKEVK